MKSTFVVHTKYTDLESRLKKVLQSFATDGEYVTKGERNVIKKFVIDGVLFNVKKFKTPNIFQSLVYRFLRKSKAKRSFEYGSKLIDLEIKTPFPVGYSEFFFTGLRKSYYISEHLDYDFDFRDLIHNPKYPNRVEILKQFTVFCFQLHENRINFLDHSPGNTLIKDGGDGTYSFYLIDLNRMRFERLSLDQRMHNLRRLWLSKTMIQIISKEYATLYGQTYDKTHNLLTKHSRAFQKKVNSKKIRRKRRKKI